jgi:hypothetical protein
MGSPLVHDYAASLLVVRSLMVYQGGVRYDTEKGRNG